MIRCRVVSRQFQRHTGQSPQIKRPPNRAVYRLNGLNLEMNMDHLKVAPILPRTNNQPKVKTNRIAEIVRSVRNGSAFEFVESSTVATTLQEAMRVLDDCHTGQQQHSEPFNEDCPLCYAMRLCAGELITLKSHAVDTLDRIEGAL
jgi:hypothetical protein